MGTGSPGSYRTGVPNFDRNSTIRPPAAVNWTTGRQLLPPILMAGMKLNHCPTESTTTPSVRRPLRRIHHIHRRLASPPADNTAAIRIGTAMIPPSLEQSCRPAADWVPPGGD